MSLSYDVSLIVISVAVAVIGSHSGLAVMLRPESLGGFRYKWRLIVSAIAIGGSIWAMHFIGMLALSLPVPVDYSVFQTLASVFIAIILTGFGLYAATSGRFGRLGNEVGALLMGSGITSMHYLGMGAIRATCIVTYDIAGALVAFGVGAVSSWLALRFVARGASSAVAVFPAAVLMGVAISGMHYVAMAGTSFAFTPEIGLALEPVLDQYYIACLAALLAFLLCDLFILVVLPEARRESPFADGARARRHWRHWRLLPRRRVVVEPLAYEAAGLTAPYAMPAALGERPLAPQALQPGPHAPPAQGSTPAPIPAQSPAPEAAAPAARKTAAPDARERLAIDSSQGVFLVEPDEILYVAANGHYTIIGMVERGSGTFEERFCSSAISIMRKRLPRDRFFQVHRSYVVNLAHARELQRQGDGGRLSLSSAMAPEIPVSRSKYRELRARLD